MTVRRVSGACPETGTTQQHYEQQPRTHQGRTKRMQATARLPSVVSSTISARRRLIRSVRQNNMHSDHNEQLVRLACPSSEDFRAISAKGADFNQLDSSSGDTPFNDILISICAGNLLGACIEAGAAVNPITTKGTSPLIQAVMAQDYRSVVILLEEGADPNIACFTDEDPQTPLDFVYNEFHCLRRPADEKVCEAMEIVFREFGGKTYSELKDEKQQAEQSDDRGQA